MGFVDKSINCSDCGSDFTFSISEQKSFAEKGYANDPQRCRLCRAARIVQSNGSSPYSGYSQPRRETFRAVCAECGKTTDLPFEPRYGRRVYCRDCYSKVRPGTGR